MQKFKFWFSKRFLVAIFVFFGHMNTFSLRANLNIAIVEMTSRHQSFTGNETIISEPEFDWDSKTKGFILGAHAYGSVVPIFGGFLVMKLGGSTVICIGSLISSILTLLTPLIVRFNFHLFVISRVLEGVAEIYKMVSFAELWSHWSPIHERSKLMAIGFSGMYAGSSVTYPLCGFVIHKYGWPAAFYLTGGISLIWAILWFFLVPNRPSSDKWISKEELAHIQQDDKQTKPNNLLSIWKGMLTSKHVYALGFSKIVYNFGVTVVITCLPMYLKDTTNVGIDQIGLYSAVPNIINILTTPLIGYMADHLYSKGILTVTQVHKLIMCMAFIIGGILLFLLAYPYNLQVSLICLASYKIMISANFATAHWNSVALAPQCASVLCGYLSLFHMIGTIAAPLAIAFVVTEHSILQWNLCFMFFGTASFIAAIVYFIFGTSEPQPWASTNEGEN